jgi:hypothetical protein
VRVFLKGPFPRGNAGIARDEWRAARAEETIGNIVRTGQARPPVSRETDPALNRGKSPCRTQWRTQWGNKEVTVRRRVCGAAARRGLRALPGYEIYLSHYEAVRRHPGFT